ncbi:hypothetical protein DPEC_G00347290 [Dallia pectoralis]|uniref:Uncharacterized protein n=1 Tax=Dallia pectoralis TaxID=75939 RepID=A0ACC2F410_DALPE|nr:hypothetical protein DPEC_G00347290 [Dallia pectoralis]
MSVQKKTEHQVGFDGSCYEFVVVQRNFLGAQGWCERGGGHLAFILNDETQQFLQKHLQPEKDWWMGLAPASLNLTLDSAAEGKRTDQTGPLSWLDGSDVSYSNWLKDPSPGPGCAHILRSSGYQWEATDNCSQELYFICQFAQKAITIQEPVGEFGALRCYSMNQSTDARNCKALYGSPFQIQVQLEAGTNVTYEVHSGEMLVAKSSTNRGIIPENITVGPDVELQMGSGCHQLTLQASNGVSVLGLSTKLQVCLLEPVEGLLASLMPECFNADLYISVSLDRGAPVQLLFQVSGANDSRSETRDMQTTSRQIYNISPIIQGDLRVKVKAWNYFSHMDFDVGNTAAVCPQGLDLMERHHENKRKTHVRVRRGNDLKITVTPETINQNTNSVQLQVTGLGGKSNGGQWDCSQCKGGKCNDESKDNSLVIEKACLPSPFQFFEYTFSVNTNGRPSDSMSVSQCITVIPTKATEFSIRCISNCNTVDIKQDVILTLTCRTTCPEVIWNFEDPTPNAGSVQNCYNSAGTKPLIGNKDQSGQNKYTVNNNYLNEAASARSQNLSVIVYDKNTLEYVKYTIVIPIATSPPVTSAPAVTLSPPSCSIRPVNGTVLDQFNITCKTPASCQNATNCEFCFKPDHGGNLSCSSKNELTSVFLPLGNIRSNYRVSVVVTVTQTKTRLNGSTTVVTAVRPARPSISVHALQFAVEGAGKLSGEALGQLYMSVSDTLNQGSSDQTNDTTRLRELMLTNMMKSLGSNSSSLTPQTVQVMASAVASLTSRGGELTANSQLQASFLVGNLSSSLLSMNVSGTETTNAATQVLEALGNILAVSSNKEVSRLLFNSINNVQSKLLKLCTVDGAPVIVSCAQITVFVRRVSPDAIQMQSINTTDGSSASFSFPPLGSKILTPGKPVDVRMLSLKSNPFSWNQANDISGTVGSVSLTRGNGSVIPIENLTEEIEIFLPMPEEMQESTIMNLGNYSTLKIDISSPDVTLVLKLNPSKDIAIQLFLGYKYYPNKKQYIAKTQIPLQGNTQEERYTWVVAPSELSGNVGMYYLVLVPIVDPGVKSVNATVTVTSINAQCKYWDDTNSIWKEDGCRVGPLTSSSATQCLCNHLTFFGSSFFVKPNLVDVSQTAQLFSTFAQNPVVVCFVGAIIVAYLLLVLWARRKDIQDQRKVKVTVLKDNDPLAEYRYMLNVSTGHRRGASTTSQVTVTLLGTEGESEPHHLTDPDKPVFERGAVDTFLLTTPFSLGELQSVRLWHDNSGGNPAWYINKIVVHDVETGKKWHFLCNSWLAISLIECTLDKVFPVATDIELKTFSNLFFMRTAKDFCDGHIWFSVISRPPTSTFTCVQRVSCCFSLLLCTMLTNVMFWGIPTDPTEQTMTLGPIQFTWQHVKVGVQSALISFPINLIIVGIFRNTRPCEKKPKRFTAELSKQRKHCDESSSQAPSTKWDRELMVDTVIKDLKKIVQSLSKTMKRPIHWPELEISLEKQSDINTLLSLVEKTIWDQCRADNCVSEKTVNGSRKLCDNGQYLYKQLCHIEKKLRHLGPSRFPNQDGYHRAVDQLDRMKGLLEPFNLGRDRMARSHDEAESNIVDSGSKKGCQGGLPWWFVFIGWILVLATSGVSGYFIMMYGLMYGKNQSISWLISMVVSFSQSLFLTQPLKVLGVAAFLSLVLKKADQEEYGDPEIETAPRNPDDPDAVQSARRDSTCSFYRPPPPSDVEKMKNNMIKEQKVFELIKEILTYVGFMWMLLLVAYGQRDPNAFFLTQHIRQSFTKGISESMKHSDVFTWANTSLLRNLFGVYPGFITDGNSKLVGNARLRQVRVQKNSCAIARSMRQAVPDCIAPYSWEVEDIGSYGPGWNRSESVNTSDIPPSPWQYQTQARLRALPIWGSVVLYRGGGFVVELGPDIQNASSTIQYLFDNTWLDMSTQAVFVEFTVYNANVNLFCIVTLMLENAAVGAFQFRSDLQTVRLYQSTGGLPFVLMASEVIYLLYILYYMYVQAKLMKLQKWHYLKSNRNLLELAIILLSWSALGVFIQRAVLGNRDIEYYQNHKDQFASFHDTANSDATLGYLIAFLVLLATMKLWNLLRLNPKLHMMTAAVHRIWTDISGLILTMVIMLLAYSIACNLMYGWKLQSYKTLLDAVMTMVSLQLGVFNYDEVQDYNPLLAAFLIGSCIIFLTFVVVNLFISVILTSFYEERINHKPSDEEETVDLMLMKLYSLFGMKMKKDN